MAKKGHSEKNLWGDIVHFDEHEKKIGTSTPNFFGGYTDYDEKGRKIGTSEPAVFGDGFTHYDNKGKKTGSSIGNLFGDGFREYDEDGNYIGYRDKSLFDLDDPVAKQNTSAKKKRTYTPLSSRPASEDQALAVIKLIKFLAITIILTIVFSMTVPKLAGYYNAYSFQKSIIKSFTNFRYDEISQYDIAQLMTGSYEYGEYPGIWTFDEYNAFEAYFKIRSNYPNVTVGDVERYLLNENPIITEEKLPEEIRYDYRQFKPRVARDYEAMLRDKTSYPYRDDDGTIIYSIFDEITKKK